MSVLSPPNGAKLSPDGPSATPAPDSTSISLPWSNSPPRPLPGSPKARSPLPWSSRPKLSARNSPAPTVAGPAPSSDKPAPCTSTAANRSNIRSRSATVPTAAGTFSPQRTSLRLDNHSYSPALLQKIVEAAGRLGSAGQAAVALNLLLPLNISARHVTRLTAEIGAELAARRDHETEQRRKRQLQPRVPTPPEVAVVEVDGGRLGTRQPGCGPGIHQPQPKEDKIACLISMDSQQHDHDPQPEPPPSFVDARRVQRLVQQIKSQSPLRDGEDAEVDASTAAAGAAPEPWAGSPRPLVRTCVASMAQSHKFGPMVAAEAQLRNFYTAGRGAFVADGQQYNWVLGRGYFGDFEPIVDFLHVLCYLYLSAYAVGGQEQDRWLRYLRWLRSCWQGRVGEVLDELAQASERLGPIPKEEELDERDPRRVAREALVYLRNNQSRMAYPRYRRAGLPVTSSLVESLVGQFNARVKGPQKYWNRPAGAEPILQVRAAVLSEDDRLARHFAQRPGNPYRRHKAA